MVNLFLFYSSMFIFWIEFWRQKHTYQRRKKVVCNCTMKRGKIWNNDFSVWCFCWEATCGLDEIEKKITFEEDNEVDEIKIEKKGKINVFSSCGMLLSHISSWKVMINFHYLFLGQVSILKKRASEFTPRQQDWIWSQVDRIILCT